MHPLKDAIQELRQIILETDATVSEHIKWNSPAFYYNGTMSNFDAKEYKRDIVIFNVRKEDYMLHIFPTGSSVKDYRNIRGELY